MPKVTDTVYRGPELADEAGYRALAEAGVTVVIDLESRFTDASGAAMEMIGAACYASDIRYIPLPMLPVLPPRQHQLCLAVSILSGPFSAGNKFYVHCRQGRDRTGMVIAAYRIKAQGWSYEQARDEMFALGFHRWRYAHWLPALKQFARENAK